MIEIIILNRLKLPGVCAVSFQPAKTNQLARSELFVHAQQHQHLLSNYLAFMTQQTVALLDMARNQQVSSLPPAASRACLRAALVPIAAWMLLLVLGKGCARKKELE